MATIAKIQTQSGIKFKAIIRFKGKVLKCKTFTRKGDAKAWAKRIEADQELIEALGTAGAVMTLDQLIGEYLDSDAKRAKPRKCKTFTQRVEWWRAALGDCKLIDITAKVIIAELDRFAEGDAKQFAGIGSNMKPLIRKLKRQRAPATVNRMKTQLSGILKFAMQKSYITRHPMRDGAVPAREEDNSRQRYLTEDELGRLLAACKASRWERLYLLTLIAVMTGARRSELLGLRWEIIDFKNRTALLADTKNGKSRLLSLPAPVITELMRFRQPEGLLFPSKRNPNRPNAFRDSWEKAIERAGIEVGEGKDKFVFHSLRHSAASFLVKNGATLFETSQILGHSSTATTERYAHLSHQHTQRVTDEIMGNLLEGER